MKEITDQREKKKNRISRKTKKTCVADPPRLCRSDRLPLQLPLTTHKKGRCLELLLQDSGRRCESRDSIFMSFVMCFFLVNGDLSSHAPSTATGVFSSTSPIPPASSAFSLTFQFLLLRCLVLFVGGTTLPLGPASHFLRDCRRLPGHPSLTQALSASSSTCLEDPARRSCILQVNWPDLRRQSSLLDISCKHP